MAAAVQALDDILKEYLLFRGFTNTLKAFEAELKSDNDKAFRVNKIVEKFISFVSAFDLQGIRDYWSYLRRRFFSRLDGAHFVNAQKLEKCLYRFYLVNAVQMSKPDKVTEFFEKMAPELQNQVDWREWFALPFLKNPEQNPSLEMYFSQLWQETFPLSLHNFLNAIFQSMPLPRLLKFDAERIISERLRQDNNHLHQKIVMLQQEISILEGEKKTVSKDAVFHSRVEVPKPVKAKEKEANFIQRRFRSKSKSEQNEKESKVLSMPDQDGQQQFGKQSDFVQPQVQQYDRTSNSFHENRNFDEVPQLKEPDVESTSSELNKTFISAENDGKNERENINSKIDDSFRESRVDHQIPSGKQTENVGEFPKEKRSFSLSGRIPSRKTSLRRATSTSVNNQPNYREMVNMSDCSKDFAKEEPTKPFLVLSEETFSEHRSPIVQCDFSPSGKLVGSVDSDGIVKVWKHQPGLSTVATVMSKSYLLCTEWATKTDKVILLGTSDGKIRLYDTETKTTRYDVSTDSQFSRVVSLACSPFGTSFVCSASCDSKSKTDKNIDSLQGTLLLWDLKTMKLERHLPLGKSMTRINCIAYNHNGTLLVTGGADGMIRLYDTRTYDCLMSWAAHQGEVSSVQFSVDETSVFSIGRDSQFLQWSLRKMGYRTATLETHDGMSGPRDNVLPGRTKHAPFSRLFTFDCTGEHLLTCSPNSGVIYKYNKTDNGLTEVFSIGENKSHVTSVDWSTTGDCITCLTGSLNGHIRLTTLLKQ